MLVFADAHKDFNSETKIWLPQGKGAYESIEARDILYVEAENHHLHIFLKGQNQQTIKSSLKDFYARSLEGFSYLKKVGRSHIVNIKRIERVENNRLIMEGNHSIPIPRDRKDEVLRDVGIKGE